MISYDDWLYALVDLPSHIMLLRQLHDTEYHAVIDNDDSRIGDGFLLRDIYVNNEWCHDDANRLYRMPCSVLELLIGVAYRIENELAQSEYEKTMDEVFYDLLDNLDILYLDDAHFKTSVVAERVDVFMNRTYNPNGHGGLFPLNTTDRDQTRVELWNQMHAWLVEKYNF